MAISPIKSKGKDNSVTEDNSTKGDTTIKISRITKERIKQFGSFGQSYEDVLNHIMDLAEKSKDKV